VAATWKETAAAGEGGGILYDLGPHVIDQARVLFGPVNEVYAEVDTRREGATNPDDVFLALHHASGVHSHLWLSAVAADLGPRFRVLGTGGAYLTWGMDPQEALLRSGARCDEVDEWGAYDESAWGARVVGDRREVVRTQPGDYRGFYRDWARALDGDGAVPVDPRDAVAGLEIIEVAAERALAAPTLEY
jgi:predicted dehydrogenase